MQKSHLQFFKTTLGELLQAEKIKKKEVRKEGRTLVESQKDSRSCPQS